MSQIDDRIKAERDEARRAIELSGKRADRYIARNLGWFAVIVLAMGGAFILGAWLF